MKKTDKDLVLIDEADVAEAEEIVESTAVATTTSRHVSDIPLDRQLIVGVDAEMINSRMETIKAVVAENMVEGIDYGSPFPGSKKNTILKPGVQKLMTLFLLRPDFLEEIVPIPHPTVAGHREYRVTCNLYSIADGRLVGSGKGSRSTMESQYRFSTELEVTDIRVGKDYWDLPQEGDARDKYLAQHGFSGRKKVQNNWFFTKGSGKQVENLNPADDYNTVLKMACKSASMEAVLNTTGASSVFDQDLDVVMGNRRAKPKGEIPAAKPAPAQAVVDRPPVVNKELPLHLDTDFVPSEVVLYWKAIGGLVKDQPEFVDLWYGFVMLYPELWNDPEERPDGKEKMLEGTTVDLLRAQLHLAQRLVKAMQKMFPGLEWSDKTMACLGWFLEMNIPLKIENADQDINGWRALNKKGKDHIVAKQAKAVEAKGEMAQAALDDASHPDVVPGNDGPELEPVETPLAANPVLDGDPPPIADAVPGVAIEPPALEFDGETPSADLTDQTDQPGDLIS